jgi:hypothetical protein
MGPGEINPLNILGRVASNPPKGTGFVLHQVVFTVIGNAPDLHSADLIGTDPSRIHNVPRRVAVGNNGLIEVLVLVPVLREPAVSVHRNTPLQVSFLLL